MKKILTLLLLMAILYVGYVTVIQPRGGEDFTADDIKAGADKIVNQVTDLYEEYGAAAADQVDEAIGEKVEQADEALEQIAGQADEAIEDAAASAVEGAKQGFIQSLKESADHFFDTLSDENTDE